MKKILDSGNRRKFESGAVRDISEGKGRCDLLPLNVIDEWLCFDEIYGDIDHVPVLVHIYNYIRNGNRYSLISALDAFCHDRKWKTCDAILEVSKHYEEGAKKYEERNWEKGIPLHCFIDSAVRHYIKWLRGDEDEPHDRAFVWNILGALWTSVDHEDIVDLPFKK